MPAKNRRAFVAYAREDVDRIASIVNELRHAGIEVSWDQDTPGGANWDDYLAREIRQADYFLWMMTPASVASQHVVAEFGAAREAGAQIRIVNLGGVDPRDALPQVGRLSWTDHDQIVPLVADMVRGSATVKSQRTSVVVGVSIAAILVGFLLGFVSGAKSAAKGGGGSGGDPSTVGELRAQLTDARAKLRLREIPPEVRTAIGILAKPGRWMPQQVGNKFLVPETMYEGEALVPHSMTALGAAGALDPTTEGLYKLYVILAWQDKLRTPSYNRSIPYPGSVDGHGVVLNPKQDYRPYRDDHPDEFKKLQKIQNALRDYHDELVGLNVLRP